MRSTLCVLCRRNPVDPAWRPFCSERCKLQDLARWADGAYRIPGDPVTEPDQDDRDPQTDASQRRTDNSEPHTEN